jgi:hypothetical protein
MNLSDSWPGISPGTAVPVSHREAIRGSHETNLLVWLLPSSFGLPLAGWGKISRKPEAETMRAADDYTETTFSVTKLDDFVPANHPLQPYPDVAERRAQAHGCGVHAHVRERRDKRSSEYCAGEIVSRVAAPGAVPDSQRTRADAADFVQHAVPMACRPGDGRWMTRYGTTRRFSKNRERPMTQWRHRDPVQ